MTPTRCHLLAFALLLLVGAPVGAQDLLQSLTSNINIEGFETTFDPVTGIATATGNVEIQYGDTEIRAGRADYNANTGDVMARDDVTVWKGGVTYKSDSIVYNIKTGELTGNTIRSSLAKGSGTLLYTTDSFKTETKFIERIDGENTFITTHDLADPNYRVRAKQLTIYPDDRIVMKKVTVYAGDTPVFWLPYVSQSLDDEVGYSFSPGWSSNWGAFLLNQYGVIHGDHTLAKYKLDLRSSRGIAGGVDFISMRHKWNQNNFGTLKLYYANDTDPTLTRTGGSREATQRLELDSSRYRVNFAHRIYIPGPEASTWYVDFDINKLSDAYFYEDFFFEEFRANREPDNQISLVHTDDRYTATLMTRFQLNDFYRVATRLPELAFDFTRQPIFDSGIFYQGNTTGGLYAENYSTIELDETRQLIKEGEAFLKGQGPIDPISGLPIETPLNQSAYRRVLGLDPQTIVATNEVEQALNILRGRLEEPGFTRVHSYHEFLYPKTLFGWLTVVPRVGGGLTYYDNIEGGDDLSTETKSIFSAGTDVSFKVSKKWDDVQNRALGLDGLRHVMQPYLNYSYVNADVPEGFPSIDRLAPTTRPRSLDVPLYSAIDDLRSWNIARVGMRNVLQTKRDYQSVENGSFREATEQAVQTYSWAGLNTYVDLFLEDPEFNRDVSNLYNELFWRPVPWLNFSADTQLPISGNPDNFTEVNYGVTWLPAKTVSLSLGHQFINDHPLFQDSSLIYSRIFARMTENWGFSMNHVYEMDDGTLEYQSYSVHRDLSSWSASIGAMIRDSRNGLSDYGLLFSLTLKDFPQVSVPLDMDPNPTGRGGRF
jgi:LPS-assembly protein